MTHEEASGLRIVVAWSPRPREVQEWTLTMPAGATVRDALAKSGLAAVHPEWAAQDLQVAVWGRAASPDQLLREDDRVEVLRPLQVDPKVARRERFKRQGVRSAGLFARKKAAQAPRAADDTDAKVEDDKHRD